MRKYLINTITNVTQNIILASPSYEAPVGFRLSETGGNIGDVLINEEWTVNTQDALEIERENMVCTRQQGKTAIGETIWNQALALLDDPDVPWALKVAITDSRDWRRTSQDMQALIWAMNLTDTQADDLFRLAITL